MDDSPGNDRNLEKEISEEQFSSSSSLSSFLSFDDGYSKPLPTSDPTPNVEGVQGTPLMHDQGGQRSGGRAIVLATGVGAGVAAIGNRDDRKVQPAPRSGDQKMKGRKNVTGQAGTSSGRGGVNKKRRKKWTLSNPTKPQCHVCDRVFKSCHALYGHMNAHNNKKRAPRVLRLPAPPVSTPPPPGGVSSERNGNGDAGAVLVLNVPQEVRLGPALPRPDGLIIDLNVPPRQVEEEDHGGDGDENKEGDKGAAK